MKLVGEAFAEEINKYNRPLPLIGIATFGMIKNREMLINNVNIT